MLGEPALTGKGKGRAGGQRCKQRAPYETRGKLYSRPPQEELGHKGPPGFGEKNEAGRVASPRNLLGENCKKWAGGGARSIRGWG